MPKLPHVAGATVTQALERLGFQKLLAIGEPRHHAPWIERLCRPLHSEVKVGTLAGILRQADVTPDEFIAAL